MNSNLLGLIALILIVSVNCNNDTNTSNESDLPHHLKRLAKRPVSHEIAFDQIVEHDSIVERSSIEESKSDYFNIDFQAEKKPQSILGSSSHKNSD